MRVLSAIAASFGFLYEAFNLGPSLISKVLQSGGTGVWLTGNIVSLAGSDNCPKVVPRICNLLFLLFFYFRPRGPFKQLILLIINNYPPTKLQLEFLEYTAC